MHLAELILALQPLLDDPHANAARITELLEKNAALAEMEVARLFVSRAFVPVVEAQAKSDDPRERMLAARAVPLVISRSVASRVLRRLVKDPDNRTRKSARAGMKRLALDDVALPDTRYKVPRWKRPLAIGGWNPTGWSFGLFGGEPRYGRNLPRQSRNVAQLPRTKLPPKIDLPAIETPHELAKLLGLRSAKAITAWLRPGEEKGSGYVAFEIPKRAGGARRIHAPKNALKKAQRRILDQILARIPTHEACHGFVKGRSIVTNAAPHEGAAVVVKMDLADFFPTIHYRRVVGLFTFYGYPPAVARLLAGLCTHRAKLADGRVAWPGVLPQGAPTSPAIANIVCRRLDARLATLAKKAGAKYTRYADDLTFSFPEGALAKDDAKEGSLALRLGRFFWWVDQICQAEGFTENAKKRRVLRRSTAQRVTGVIVNDKISAPREVRRRLRAMVDRCRKQGLAAVAKAEGRPDLAAVMAGTAAYVAMVQPEAGQKLARAVADVIAKAGSEPAKS